MQSPASSPMTRRFAPSRSTRPDERAVRKPRGHAANDVDPIRYRCPRGRQRSRRTTCPPRGSASSADHGSARRPAARAPTSRRSSRTRRRRDPTPLPPIACRRGSTRCRVTSALSVPAAGYATATGGLSGIGGIGDVPAPHARDVDARDEHRCDPSGDHQYPLCRPISSAATNSARPYVTSSLLRGCQHAAGAAVRRHDVAGLRSPRTRHACPSDRCVDRSPCRWPAARPSSLWSDPRRRSVPSGRRLRA